MTILIFNGSPRQEGNTDLLLKRVEERLAQLGSTAVRFDLAKLKIQPCISCGHCETSGDCILEDDMIPLYEHIEATDNIILASPVYFYGVTAQMKAFIDRCQTLWSRKYILKRSRRLHDGDQGDRRGFLLSVAARTGLRTFEGVRLTAHYTFDVMNCSYSGELLVNNVDQKGAVLAKEEAMQEALYFAEKIAGAPISAA